MSRPALWASKVTALIQGGNTQAALAQIKVAPSVKDVEQLRTQLENAASTFRKSQLLHRATEPIR